MIILDREDQKMAVERLEALRTEMLDRLAEMGDIIRSLSSDNRLIWERAKSYWYTSIENNLYEDSGSFLGSVVNFSDTIKELKEIIEEEETPNLEEEDPGSYFDK